VTACSNRSSFLPLCMRVRAPNWVRPSRAPQLGGRAGHGDRHAVHHRGAGDLPRAAGARAGGGQGARARAEGQRYTFVLSR
jgi:hypothetical protein